MESKSKRIEPLLFLYDAHTKLYPNVIEGISDKDAHDRLGTKANHVAWLAGSLVQHRAENAKMLGTDVKQVADDLFKDFQGIKDDVTYPALSTFRADWDRITSIFRDELLKIDDKKLDEILDMGEGMKMPYFDAIAYGIHREAYVIGQIALWRRLLGYDAMKYPGM
jgi:hypothetical protein